MTPDEILRFTIMPDRPMSAVGWLCVVAPVIFFAGCVLFSKVYTAMNGMQ